MPKLAQSFGRMVASLKIMMAADPSPTGDAAPTGDATPTPEN